MRLILHDETKIWLKQKKQQVIAWKHELDAAEKFYKFEWQCVLGTLNCMDWDAACRIEYEAAPNTWYSTAGKWADSYGVPEGTHPVSHTSFVALTKTWFVPEDLKGKKVKIRIITSLEYAPYPNTMGFANMQFDDLVVFGE
jgi:hypothetical protein